MHGYNAQAMATTDQFVFAAEVTNIAMDAPAYAPMVTAAKNNLKAAGEPPGAQSRCGRGLLECRQHRHERRGVVHRSGRTRQWKKITETEQTRTAILHRVEAGEIDTMEASEQLGVTRARVNQLLRRRRAGDPDPLTTTMIAKLDTPRGRKTYNKRAPSIELCAVQPGLMAAGSKNTTTEP